MRIEVHKCDMARKCEYCCKFIKKGDTVIKLMINNNARSYHNVCAQTRLESLIKHLDRYEL